ncbi:MAG: DNA polymerase III subunit delta [Candidatus Marinamargulisbacteria bacterium]
MSIIIIFKQGCINFLMFYLITGENTTLIEDEKNRILTEFKDIPFEDSKTTSLNEFIHATEACDMFSPQKGFICTNPKWLKKVDKINIASLEQCLKNAHNFKLPIIIIATKIDKRSACYKLFKKQHAIELNCPEFKEWESQKVIDWILSYCQNQGTTINSKSAQMLINAYGNNLGIIKQEINKCLITILPEKTITEEHLLHASSNSMGEYNQLSSAIKTGNIQNILKHIFNLLEQKEDAHKIMNQLVFQINQLIPLSLGDTQQMQSDQLATKLGKHPFFIKKQLESLQKNTLKHKLPNIIQKLGAMDLAIKSGKQSAKQALIDLSNLLKYQI